MRGRYERVKEKKAMGKGSKTALIIGIVLLVLVLAVVAAAVIYYISMMGKLNQVEVPKIQYTQAATEALEETAAPTEAETEATEPHIASRDDYINVLVVGQSGRPGEDARLADTMLLFTINTYEETLTMTSLLRDTLVKMPDFNGHYGGRIKLTTVYHLGSYYTDGDEKEKIGGSMAIINQCLYDNFGIEVDYNFEVNFDAFMEALNLIDGIEIEITEEEAEYLNRDDRWVTYEIEPGLAYLDGMAALSYARMRKATGDGDSDITRTSRQRKLMEAILEKVRYMGPSKLQRLADNLLPMVATSMSTADITKTLLRVLPTVRHLEIKTSGTCPANYEGVMKDIYDDGQLHSVLVFNAEKTKLLMRELTLGETQPTEPTAAPAN